jgi:hypothetical protein
VVRYADGCSTVIGIDVVFPATMAALAVAALRATGASPADDASPRTLALEPVTA